MKKPQWLIYGLLSLLLFASCEREVDWDTSNHQTKLVLNALFNPDSSWSIELSKTRAVLDANSPTDVNDAEVYIYQTFNGNPANIIPFLTNLSTGPSLYRNTSITPEAGINYTVEVFKEGFEVLTAQGVMPQQPTLGSSQLIPTSVSSYEFKGDININFDDPANETNYYHLIVRRANIDFDGISYSLNGYRKEEFTFNSVPGAEAFYTEGFLFTDEQFNGTTKFLELGMNTDYDDDLEAYDHFLVELRSVSKDYYDYHLSVNDQYYSPANKYVEIHSNIDNGLGIFAGYYAATRKIPFL